jgi:hypothetical protein
MCPHRPGHYFKGYQIGDADRGEQFVEKMHRHIGGSIVNNKGKQEKVEKHVKEVKPEIFPEAAMFTPGFGKLHYKEEKGNTNEPVKIIMPGRVGDLTPQIVGISCIAVPDKI